MAALIAAAAGANALRTLVRRCSKDTVVELAAGCVVYQDLKLVSEFEHSGIHIGDYRVVSLDMDGDIVEETTRQFAQGGANERIYVSCRGEVAVGGTAVAKRAREMMGKSRDYNFIMDNCHQFTSGCLTGNFENGDNFLSFLKTTASEVIGVDNWRLWAREEDIQRQCKAASREIIANRNGLERMLRDHAVERSSLLESSLDKLRVNCGIEDVDAFLGGLVEMAAAYGGDLPWHDFETFDKWMEDDATVLKLD